jgi:hypothetical protein
MYDKKEEKKSGECEQKRKNEERKSGKLKLKSKTRQK